MAIPDGPQSADQLQHGDLGCLFPNGSQNVLSKKQLDKRWECAQLLQGTKLWGNEHRRRLIAGSKIRRNCNRISGTGKNLFRLQASYIFMIEEESLSGI